MRTFTVSVDDETYRLACVKAAENGTSVSNLVQLYLTNLTNDSDSAADFERLQRLQHDTIASIAARGGGLRSSDNLPRSELHEPDALS